MAVNKKSLENLKKGNRFSPTNQPDNRGRRKNKFFELVDKEQVSRDDIRAMFSGIIINYSFGDIKKLHDEGKEDQPVINAALEKALMYEHDRGRVDTLFRLIEYIHGKPTQQISYFDKKNDIPDDPDERRALIEKIEKGLTLANNSISEEDANS